MSELKRWIARQKRKDRRVKKVKQGTVPDHQVSSLDSCDLTVRIFLPTLGGLDPHALTLLPSSIMRLSVSSDALSWLHSPALPLLSRSQMIPPLFVWKAGWSACMIVHSSTHSVVIPACIGGPVGLSACGQVGNCVFLCHGVH